MRQLAATSPMPTITLQVLPAVAHCVNTSGFVIADHGAAYAEHVAAGYVFTDTETVSAIAVRFDNLRGECCQVSESAALIERMAGAWERGVSPLTQTGTTGTA